LLKNIECSGYWVPNIRLTPILSELSSFFSALAVFAPKCNYLPADVVVGRSRKV